MGEKYPFEWKFSLDWLEIHVRFSIFSIIGASAGLPALVWCVSELIEHRKNGHRISFFIVLLLLTDFAEVFLTPYIVIKHLLNELYVNINLTCWVFWSLWCSLRVCGLLLNKLVALEGLLSVRYPLYTAAVFSSACFKIFYILVFLLVTICCIFLPNLSIPLLVTLYIMSVIPWIIYCGALCSAERHSQTSKKPDPHIWVFFILNLLVVYLPLIVILFFFFSLLWNSIIKLVYYYLVYTVLLVSLRPISDPLLCVLVSRQNFHLLRSQKAEETSVA